MKVYLKFFLYTIFIFCAELLVAQNDIPIGSWRTHLPYRNAKAVAPAGNRIFVATDHSLFFFDKEDNSTTKLTKVDGFSEVDIATIAYEEDLEILLVTYKNGNIDFVHKNEIINFNLIKRTQLRNSKNTNHINFYDGKAYLSTDFGVVVLDIEEFDIVESYLNIGKGGSAIAVNSSAITGDSIYLATSQGVQAAPINTNINLLDFNNWRRLGINEGLPEKEVGAMATNQGKIYAGINQDGLYIYEGAKWEKLDFQVNEDFHFMNVSRGALFFGLGNELFKIENTKVTAVKDALIQRPRLAALGEDGKLWVADLLNGLVSDFEGAFNNYFPSGPFSVNTWKLLNINNRVIAISGGYGDNLGALDNVDGFYVFEAGAWINYNPSGLSGSIKTPDVEDLVDVVYNPVTGKIYFASFGGGLLEWNGENEFQVLNENTQGSSLSNSIITGLATDRQGALWITSLSSPNILHSLDTEGEWTPFSFDLNVSPDPRGIIITDFGVKWVRLGRGILVFDEETGNQRVLTGKVGEGDLPGNKVTDIAIDKEGQIWVGTDQGIAFFTNPSAVFSVDFRDVSRPVFENRFLFRNELITAIKVDGGNRKWIGTENGLWLFGEAGDTLIHKFTEDNSPLLSNNIIDIEINENSGEVFIATDKGMASFRGTATKGEEIHQKVKIFPNPATRDFSGLVGISGLVNNAIVKITDISGNLVREFRAEGGTATWNLADVQGRRVQTGVYLVFSSSDDGQETFVGKIAVVN